MLDNEKAAGQSGSKLNSNSEYILPKNDTKDNHLLETAKRYDAVGLSVIPIKSDKTPAVISWSKFQKERPTSNQINNWFDGSDSQVKGIAIIAGQVSGNLEVIDIDSKYDQSGEMSDEFLELVKEHLPQVCSKLVIAETVNGGLHILYRCEEIEGNKKLAQRPATADEWAKGDKVKVLFETRGTGGYIAAAPTRGYEFIQGSVESLPTITPKERAMLFSIAGSFDLMPVKVSEAEQKQTTGDAKRQNDGISPFDDYNERADIPALLQLHGWTRVSERGGRIHFKRPGTTDAKTSANFQTSSKVFNVFSSSTEFEAERGYNPVGVYTILEHGGDYSAASKQLYKDGYGARRTRTQDENTEQAINAEWQDPKPLDLTLKPVETIDDDFLPNVLTDWLRPASKVIGCPFGFLALSAVVMVATLIGSRLRVKPLKNSDWFVVPNLYAGIVGLPSAKKTPALDETRKPILELQCEARKQFKELVKEYTLDLKFYEKEAQKILKESATKEDYRRNIASCPELQKPILKRYETNDITASKLIQFLSDNPPGLLLFRDELTGWLKSLEADYDKNSRSFFLELWKGAISYELARVDGREIQLTSGTISIIGGVQPSKLQRYVSETYSFDNSDGFLQRFMFDYSDPEKSIGKPTANDYEQMKRGYAKANEICKLIAKYDFGERVTGANNDDKFEIVQFTVEAQKTVDQWQAEIEDEARSLEVEDEAFSSFLYKLPKSCYAIALIFHCLENIKEKNFPDEITVETTLRAISYASVLTSHARRVFALGENQIFALAQTLLGKIKKGELQNGFTLREVARKQWSGLRAKDAVMDVTKLLCDYGYLREIGSNGEGRPTTNYYIHPSLVKGAKNEN